MAALRLCSIADLATYLATHELRTSVYQTLDAAEEAAGRFACALSEEGRSPCVLRADCVDGRCFIVLPTNDVKRVSEALVASFHEVAPRGPRYLALDIDIPEDEISTKCSAEFEVLVGGLCEHMNMFMEGVAAWMKLVDPVGAAASLQAGVFSCGVRGENPRKISVHVTTTRIVLSTESAKAAAEDLKVFLLERFKDDGASSLLARRIDMNMYTKRHSIRIPTTPKIEYDEHGRGVAVPGSVHTFFSGGAHFFEYVLVTGEWLAPVAFSRRSPLDHEQ